MHKQYTLAYRVLQNKISLVFSGILGKSKLSCLIYVEGFYVQIQCLNGRPRDNPHSTSQFEFYIEPLLVP